MSPTDTALPPREDVPTEKGPCPDSGDIAPEPPSSEALSRTVVFPDEYDEKRE
jgi:hypothetical protein